MSFIKEEDSSKWINALIIIFSAVVGYAFFKFSNQMAVWFDLETKLANFAVIAQVVGFLAGLTTFIVVLKNEFTSNYVQEVFAEFAKVVWPSRGATTKLTITLVIGLVIVAAIFVFVDFRFNKLLTLIF